MLQVVESSVQPVPQVAQAGEVKPPAYIFVDLETTGLSIIRHGICQIGAYATTTNENHVLGYFVKDADPRGGPITIDESAFAVNGFTHIRLSQAYALERVLKQFTKFISDIGQNYQPVLVMHNAKFDTPRLEIAYERAGLEFPFTRRVLCTVSLAHAILGRELRSLKDLAAHFGIQNDSAHDALSDAIVTSKVYHALMRQAQKPPVYKPSFTFGDSRPKLSQKELTKLLEATQTQPSVISTAQHIPACNPGCTDGGHYLA